VTVHQDVQEPVSSRRRSIDRGPVPGAAPSLPVTRPRRVVATLLLLTAALIVASLVSAGTGQLHVPADEVLGSVFHKMGLDLGPMPHHPNGEAVLWHIRFPRLVMGLLVGASLG
jgi:iron complex transport system permease protein